MPADPFIISAIAEVHERGIAGACLMKRDVLVANHFPRSDATVSALCEVVYAMSRGYASVGRLVNEYYFGYDGGLIAVFVRGELQLVLLGERAEDPETVIQAGRRFFEDQTGFLTRLSRGDSPELLELGSPRDIANG